VRHSRTSRRWPFRRLGSHRKNLPRDCIRAYTSGSAYAEFMEGKKGELKAGELADFIRPLRRPNQNSALQFTKTTVLMTIVGGRTVYANIK